MFRTTLPKPTSRTPSTSDVALFAVRLDGAKVRSWRMPGQDEAPEGIWHRRYYGAGTKYGESAVILEPGNWVGRGSYRPVGDTLGISFETSFGLVEDDQGLLLDGTVEIDGGATLELGIVDRTGRVWHLYGHGARSGP